MNSLGKIILSIALVVVGLGLWHTFRTGDGLARHVHFTSDLIDAVRTRYHIDPDRIYASAMSHGCGVTFVFSCERQPGRRASHEWTRDADHGHGAHPR